MNNPDVNSNPLRVSVYVYLRAMRSPSGSAASVQMLRGLLVSCDWPAGMPHAAVSGALPTILSPPTSSRVHEGALYMEKMALVRNENILHIRVHLEVNLLLPRCRSPNSPPLATKVDCGNETPGRAMG